eukprot:1974617-Amphidinium_carterae.1
MEGGAREQRRCSRRNCASHLGARCCPQMHQRQGWPLWCPWVMPAGRPDDVCALPVEGGTGSEPKAALATQGACSAGMEPSRAGIRVPARPPCEDELPELGNSGASLLGAKRS